MAAYSKQDWDAFVAAHGGTVGQEPVETDAVIHDSDPVLAKNSAYDTPNPYQAVKYTFKDGTYITVRPDPGTDQGGADAGFNVVNGGTALKGSGSTPKAPTTRNIGGHTQQWDEATQQWIDPPGVDSTATTAPKNLVPGSGSPGIPDYSGTSQGGSDTSGPAMVGATPDQPVDVVNAQTSRQNADRASQQADIQNQRQQANDLLAQQNQKISNELAAGRLSLDQAKEAYNEAHQQVSDWLTQRGQNLNYLGNQSYVTAGQYQAQEADRANLAKTGGVAYTPSPTPPPLGYDPAQLAATLAQQALANNPTVQQPFSMGQAPAAPSGGGFAMPVTARR